MKDVLTTGQVAKICHVTIRTVIKWFETGKLRGYKIPGSKDRRIPRENLLRFLRDHDIPHDEQLFDSRPTVLIADDDPEMLGMLEQVFSADGELRVFTAQGGYQAGFETMRRRPSLLLIDYNLGDTNAWEVLETVGSIEPLADMRVIIMTGFHDDAGVLRLVDKGLRVVHKPFDAAALHEEVRDLIGLPAPR